MKATFLSVVAIPALVMVSTSAFAAIEGETSTVQFKGAIKENTCVLASNSISQVVNLNTVESSVFQTMGDASLPANFTIALEDCDTSKATVTFSGETENDTTLKVNGGAEGVGIQILENGKPLKVDGSAPSSQKEVGEAGAEWIFGARYIGLGGTITSGDANATAQFTVNYE